MSFGAVLLAAHKAALPGVPGFNTMVPDQPSARKWFVVYPDGGTFPSDSLCRPGDQGVVRWVVNCVAPSEDEASWMSWRIRTYFTEHDVTADGFAPAAVEHEIAVQARPDEDVRAVPLVVCSDRYLMTVTKEG